MSKYHIVGNYMSRLKCFNNYRRINVSLMSSRADFYLLIYVNFFRFRVGGENNNKKSSENDFQSFFPFLLISTEQTEKLVLEKTNSLY